MAEEIREDDTRRKQSLEQLREWIAKNHNIKKCRSDTIFLLRYLRVKKYSVPRAAEMLQNALMVRQIYPHWFQNLDIGEPLIEELLDNGYLFPLRQRDSLGRRVLLSRACQMDTDKCSSVHSVRLSSLIFSYLLDEEESQIAGYVYIVDAAHLTAKHLSIFSFVEFKDFMKCVQTAIPIRIQAFHVFNMPPVATAICELVLSVMSAKVKSRVHIHKPGVAMNSVIDPKIIPQEYGGSESMKSMIDDFKEKLRNNREAILDNDNQNYINITGNMSWSKEKDPQNVDLGVSGSFRKLEID